MNKNAEAWVAALLSDEYEQGRLVLHRKATPTAPDEWCCLGVACDLYLKAGGELDVIEHDDGHVSYNSASCRLPDVVRTWLGLRRAVGSMSRRAALGELNDSGFTFAEIAAIIAAEPEGLFEAPLVE